MPLSSLAIADCLAPISLARSRWVRPFSARSLISALLTANSGFKALKTTGKPVKRKTVLYARVSTNKQKRDLENQLELLKQFCINNGWTIDGIYKDIASALDFDSRKDFNELIKEILNYRIEKVVVAYKDRLTRTGFNFFENLFRSYGTEIVVINNYTNEKSGTEELMEEIFTLLRSFSKKFYSSRRKIKKCLEEALK